MNNLWDKIWDKKIFYCVCIMQLNIHKVRHEVYAVRFISCESVLHNAWVSWEVKRGADNIHIIIYIIWVLFCIYEVFYYSFANMQRKTGIVGIEFEEEKTFVKLRARKTLHIGWLWYVYYILWQRFITLLCRELYDMRDNFNKNAFLIRYHRNSTVANSLKVR